ncbi:hypothetical protein Slin15195_G129610 [Septoria linicola]|uniref:Uncharacterized protein n=1 Tax=Septoria linicola TaxID=215465 RepID=A0A9Q9ER86_9PEZI|nr:hypothetical protein Slin15195_G129610 [Septoria linicola]
MVIANDMLILQEAQHEAVGNILSRNERSSIQCCSRYPAVPAHVSSSGCIVNSKHQIRLIDKDLLIEHLRTGIRGKTVTRMISSDNREMQCSRDMLLSGRLCRELDTIFDIDFANKDELELHILPPAPCTGLQDESPERRAIVTSAPFPELRSRSPNLSWHSAEPMRGLEFAAKPASNPDTTMENETRYTEEFPYPDRTRTALLRINALEREIRLLTESKSEMADQIHDLAKSEFRLKCKAAYWQDRHETRLQQVLYWRQCHNKQLRKLAWMSCRLATQSSVLVAVKCHFRRLVWLVYFVTLVYVVPTILCWLGGKMEYQW